VSKRKLTFLRFLGQDVALESVLPFDLARTCHVETFLGAGLGFHFRHYLKFIVLLLTFFFLKLFPVIRYSFPQIPVFDTRSISFRWSQFSRFKNTGFFAKAVAATRANLP